MQHAWLTEVVKLLFGSRWEPNRIRILRTLFTEAVLISLAGGALGLWGSVALLRALSVWQPLPRYPISVPVNPDANVYGVALILALVSGILFGVVPVRQVLRTDPYQIVKAGSSGAVGRRITIRDLLLVVQIAICAVLVTSSMVAVRGLLRSLHSNFGFDPRNVMIVNTDLSMAGYSGERVPEMQKRMLDAMRAIPGVESAGLIDWPPLISGAYGQSAVFSDQSPDLSPSSAAATAFSFRMSPEYFQAAGTALLAGRTFSWHDDKNAPRVAVVNREFATKMFGSPANALGHFYKLGDGTRIQVVGIVESGKYKGLTDDSALAMFLPILQSPTLATNLVIRSSSDPRQVEAAIKSTLRDLDRGLPSYIETWSQQLDDFTLFPSRVATVALGVLGDDGRDAVHHWHLWNGCLLGQQAAEGIRNSRCPRRAADRSAAGSLGTRNQMARLWFGSRTAPRNSGQPGARVHRVSGNTPRSAGIGRGCSSDGVAGLAGHLGSSPARALARSFNTAARGVRWL